MIPPTYTADVSVRPLATATRMPLLPRLQMRYVGRRRGVQRLIRKAVKAGFRLVHQRLGVPAYGEIRLGDRAQGLRFRANFGNTAYTQFLLAETGGGFEPEVAALLKLLAPRLRVVLDIGANCGFFTARLLSDPHFVGELHAFEINPSTYRDLEQMVRDCGFGPRVTCHPFGLSDADATLRLNVGMHSTLARVDNHGRVLAEVRTLDGLELPEVDLIKLDVEGHEAPVLAGAIGLLTRDRPAVLMESWYRPDAKAEMLAPLLRLDALGYQFYQLDHVRTRDTVRLTLQPFTVEGRADIDEQINILAVNPQRSQDLLSGMMEVQ